MSIASDKRAIELEERVSALEKLVVSQQAQIGELVAAIGPAKVDPAAKKARAA